MIHVDPAHTFTVAPAQQEQEADRGGNGEAFSSVFASARQSSNRLLDLLTRQTNSIADTFRRHQQVADSLSGSSRADALRRSEKGRSTGKPSRVDRLRSSVNNPASAQDRAQRLADLRERADAAELRQGARTLKQQTPSESLETAIADDTAAREQIEAAPSQMFEEPTGAAGQAVAGQASEGNQRNGANQTNSANSSAETADRPVQVIQPLFTSPQNGRNGGQANTGVFQDASGAGKTAEIMSKPGNAGIEFQNILAGAGRGRSSSPAARTAGPSLQNARAAVSSSVNLNESGSVNELADIVRTSMGSRRSVMMMRLDPPELGKLRIDIQMQDQALTLRFQAQTVAGYDALQARLGELRSALEQHGIQLNQVEVEFRPPASPTNGPHDAGSQQQSPTQGGDFGEASGGNSQEASDNSFASSADLGEEALASTGFFEDDGVDGVRRPAETGVDLVV